MMLEIDPSQRVTADDALKHPWIAVCQLLQLLKANDCHHFRIASQLFPSFTDRTLLMGSRGSFLEENLK